MWRDHITQLSVGFDQHCQTWHPCLDPLSRSSLVAKTGIRKVGGSSPSVANIVLKLSFQTNANNIFFSSEKNVCYCSMLL